MASLQAIRAFGIRIAIDDSGIGSSSLGDLAKLPIDSLKIDRMFVTDMTTAARGLSLVSTIIDPAHWSRLSVVAQGVETEQQAKLLNLLRCDEMQVYLFSKPIPAVVLEPSFLPQPSCVAAWTRHASSRHLMTIPQRTIRSGARVRLLKAREDCSEI